MRPGLVPGVNVDKVSITEGLQAAKANGFLENWHDQVVVEYALKRYARGEEEGAVKTWTRYFGAHNLTGWYLVLASARAGGED